MDARKVPPAAHMTVSLPAASIHVVPARDSEMWEAMVWMSATALADLSGVNMHKDTAQFIELYQMVETAVVNQMSRKTFIASAAAEAVAILVEDGLVAMEAADDSPIEQALASQQLYEIVSCLGGVLYMAFAILRVADEKQIDLSGVGNRVVDFKVALKD